MIITRKTRTVVVGVVVVLRLMVVAARRSSRIGMLPISSHTEQEYHLYQQWYEDHHRPDSSYSDHSNNDKGSMYEKSLKGGGYNDAMTIGSGIITCPETRRGVMGDLITLSLGMEGDTC